MDNVVRLKSAIGQQGSVRAIQYLQNLKVGQLMKLQTKWIFPLLVFGLVNLSGCLSGRLAIHEGEERMKNLAITDEIVALGKPSPELAKTLELEHAVAFIGLQHTYLLYEGGEEIERISQLKLDNGEIDIGTTWSSYVKDSKVWGNVVVNISLSKRPSSNVHEELTKGGFVLSEGNFILLEGNTAHYSKLINVEGIVAPAIEIPKNQFTSLSRRHKILLFKPNDSAHSKLKNTSAVPVKVAAALLDVVLIPAYITLGGIVMFAMATGQ
jgi:hypothetical protein